MVLTALGVTPTSHERQSLRYRRMRPRWKPRCGSPEFDAVAIINTLLVSLPGKSASGAMRLFTWMPGWVGRGAREQQAAADAIGRGAFSSVRWTLVRGGLNSRGKNEAPVSAVDWPGALNSWMPVSYEAMARWMIEEAAAGRYVKAAPLVSRRR